MQSNPLRSRVLSGGLLALISLAFLGSLSARNGSDPARAPAENKYIGADKCKSCHGTAEGGDQYGAWKQEKHARAFETLASEEGKKLAEAKGIADPQKDAACLECHVTAFGVPEEQLKKGFDKAAGVQCESCHGPGEQHMKARFAAAAKGDAATAPIPADEIVARPSQAKCLECHNDRSPSFKPFCFHKRNAEIRHLDPRKAHAAGDLLDCGCATCACSKGCPDDGCGVPAGGKKDAK